MNVFVHCNWFYEVGLYEHQHCFNMYLRSFIYVTIRFFFHPYHPGPEFIVEFFNKDLWFYSGSFQFNLRKNEQKCIWFFVYLLKDKCLWFHEKYHSNGFQFPCWPNFEDFFWHFQSLLQYFVSKSYFCHGYKKRDHFSWL